MLFEAGWLLRGPLSSSLGLDCVVSLSSSDNITKGMIGKEIQHLRGIFQ